MKRNPDELLRQLKARRGGTDRISRVALNQQQEILDKQAFREAYEQRAADKPFTRYALGAMQAVDADYTRISLETSERVAQQLLTRLTRVNRCVSFRNQGSVPLNVHIRGVSDVDLLVIEEEVLLYDPRGRKATIPPGYPPAPRTAVDMLASLRTQAERDLVEAYPAATVDRTNSKAIKISGGSLARPVDVVPAVWWDTVAYQQSLHEYDRGVSIYDRGNHAVIANLPFLHIKRVRERCDTTAGGLRKAIRLCKQVKADAEEEGSQIRLSSYEIAGLMYHADMYALGRHVYNEMEVLVEAQRLFSELRADAQFAHSLITPDESRAILDTTQKFAALGALSLELDALLTEVARENSATLRYQASPGFEASRGVLREAVIP